MGVIRGEASHSEGGAGGLQAPLPVQLRKAKLHLSAPYEKFSIEDVKAFYPSKYELPIRSRCGDI